jgi:hypothetical protein
LFEECDEFVNSIKQSKNNKQTTTTTNNNQTFFQDDPLSIVSPGGVGFDINCGVRLLRTNLHLRDVLPVKEELTQLLFDFIPVGVGSKGIIPTDAKQLSGVCVCVCLLRCFVSFVLVTLLFTTARAHTHTHTHTHFSLQMYWKWGWIGLCEKDTRG